MPRVQHRFQVLLDLEELAVFLADFLQLFVFLVMFCLYCLEFLPPVCQGDGVSFGLLSQLSASYIEQLQIAVMLLCK